MRCFYHPDYTYPLPEKHPFPMDKFWRAEQIVRTECPNVRIQMVAPASVPQLMRVHTAGYLTTIRTGSLSREALVRLGLPPCEELLTRSRRETAGTVAAMWAALEDGLACNLAGGTHHAFPDRGQGYCVLNDVAIAIRDLHATDPGRRVFVIDTDAHQGNGTNEIFADDDRVFTYSIHVGRNYPAEKKPGSLDVELERYVVGADYLDRLGATLPSAFDRFAPDLAFWISGSDPHENDRFGQMKLSDADITDRDRAVLELVTDRRVPTVVLYGGGYNRDRVHTARLHANTVKSAESFWQAPYTAWPP
ncbi:MAG TPA: histone deacetylase [Terrimicrobiaceae bacterium]|nr:histone deacetylase [Terrimicrobiaceae bacterium]